MVYFHSDYLLVEYHNQSDVLISQWYGGCSSLQYRQALINSVKLARELNVKFAVLDRRLLPILSDDDLQWTTGFYHKAYPRLPFKKLAVINAFDEAAERQQHYLDLQQTTRFETRNFDDLTSAYDWLISASA